MALMKWGRGNRKLCLGNNTQEKKGIMDRNEERHGDDENSRRENDQSYQL